MKLKGLVLVKGGNDLHTLKHRGLKRNTAHLWNNN